MRGNHVGECSISVSLLRNGRCCPLGVQSLAGAARRRVEAIPTLRMLVCAQHD